MRQFDVIMWPPALREPVKIEPQIYQTKEIMLLKFKYCVILQFPDAAFSSRERGWRKRRAGAASRRGARPLRRRPSAAPAWQARTGRWAASRPAGPACRTAARRPSTAPLSRCRRRPPPGPGCGRWAPGAGPDVPKGEENRSH